MENEFTPIQKFIILLSGSNNKEPIKGKTWLQKEMFLLSKNIQELENETSFEADFYGPLSESVEQDMEELEVDGFIEVDDKVYLTEEGFKAFKDLQKKSTDKELELVKEVKGFLNSLTYDELLAFVYFSYPKYAEESKEKEKIQRMRVDLAVSMYRKGLISIEKASEIAGVPIERLMKLV